MCIGYWRLKFIQVGHPVSTHLRSPINLQPESSHHCTSVRSKRSYRHVQLLNGNQTLYVDAHNSRKNNALCTAHATSPRLPRSAIEDKCRRKGTHARQISQNLHSLQTYTNLQPETNLYRHCPCMAVTWRSCNLDLRTPDRRDICTWHTGTSKFAQDYWR